MPLGYDRIIKNIERVEAKIFGKDENMKAIGKKLDLYKNPQLELKIQIGQKKAGWGKLKFPTWHVFIGQRVRHRRMIRGVPKKMDE